MYRQNFLYVLYTSLVLALVALRIYAEKNDRKNIIPNRYPFLVSIELSDTQDFPLCAGSLISASHVLTSAFCMDINWGTVIKELVVKAGSEYLKPSNNYSVTERKVMRKVTHPKYQEKHDRNNIAILLLWEPFDLKKNSNIKTIQFNGDSYSQGSVCRSLGWGSEKNFDYKKSNIALKSIVVHLYHSKFCEFMFQIQIGPGQACAERPSIYEGICTIDIGSPLICNNSLVGILSRYANCQDILEPNIYTLVPKYTKFVHYVADPFILEKCSRIQFDWIFCIIGNFLTEWLVRILNRLQK